jgi:VRR-NUC domain
MKTARTLKSVAQVSVKKTVAESVIQHHILVYLNLRGVFAWLNPTGGYFDVEKKVMRKHQSKFAISGPSDILAIWRGGGHFVAIEVKTKTGKVTYAQKDFLSRINENGGFAFVARRLEDVIDILFNGLTLAEIRHLCEENVASQKCGDRQPQARLRGVL